MNRPYTAHSPYSLTPTERIQSYTDDTVGELEEYRYEDYDENYGEFDDYDEARIDRRWMWIAGVAGAILFVAVITTGVILGGGDSGSVSTIVTSAGPTTSRAPVTTSPPPAATTPATPPATSLPPETVTTVSPTASAPPSAAPTAAPPAPNTITYTVTGNRQLIDLVTVIYTDQQGALQTDVNVALPWSRTVVLDPGVELSSVTATSVGGQLNCSITDASGAMIAAQSNNTMIATCTK